MSDPSVRAAVEAATLEQLEALAAYGRCHEWQKAVLQRLSCSGVDEAELAQWPEAAWASYYARLEVLPASSLPCFL